MKLSSLAPDAMVMIVKSYDSLFDTYEIELHDASPCEGQCSLIPTRLLFCLVEGLDPNANPQTYIGREFIVRAR